MSFCFGFISNDSELVRCAIDPFGAHLRVTGAPHGWGLAYYQLGNPLVSKQPKPGSDAVDFASVAGRFRSNLVIGHVREATIGGQRTENTHPFRYRGWTFCHSGTVEKFDAVKDDLLRSIPEFIRRNIRGQTDSEHVFHLFLSFLNDTGKLDDPRIPPQVAAAALGSTFAYLGRLVVDHGGGELRGCLLLTNGSFLLALRSGVPLKVSRQSSFACTDAEGRPVPSAHLKAAVVIGGTPPDCPGWETVADRSVLTVDKDLNIVTASLG